MSNLSQQIRECKDGPYHNPFQGEDKRVVFVCSMGILRSATGARLYAHMFNTRTCGTWDDALIPLSKALIEWADELVFVNKENYLGALGKYKDDEYCTLSIYDKAIVLNISDVYPHMAKELVEEFKQQYKPL